MIKNLIILPKACFIAEQILLRRIEHIHAYWATTSATTALVASCLTGIPWSFTGYRWDVAENNLLNLKQKRSTFIRCPDHKCKDEIAEICDLKTTEKLRVIRTGTKILHETDALSTNSGQPRQKPLRFVVPAFFVEKKGHIYFLEATRILVDRGYRFRCWLIGSGPLENNIGGHIKRLKLENLVEIKGLLPLDALRTIFRTRQADVVVLPSIVTADNQREGIPGSLIDALAYGVPVISTPTGGIPELVTPEIGILVEHSNAVAIADAMEYMITHPDHVKAMSEAARLQMKDEFDVVNVVRHMIALMQTGTSHRIVNNV